MNKIASIIFTMLSLILTEVQAYDSTPYRWNEYRGSGYRDTDHDGVRDFQDVCPRSYPDLPVNSVGCHYGFPFDTSELDEEANDFENGLAGCPDLAPERYILSHVAETFVFDSAKLTAEIREGLDEFQNRVNAARVPFVAYLTGFADPRGTVPYNQALGWHRALAVKEYLVESGWSRSRISVRGAGEDGPSSLGLESVGRYVEIRISFGECGKTLENTSVDLSYDDRSVEADTEMLAAVGTAGWIWGR